jgi:hypothetical protein
LSGKSKTKKQEGMAGQEWDGFSFFFKCPELFILEEIDEETMDSFGLISDLIFLVGECRN